MSKSAKVVLGRVLIKSVMSGFAVERTCADHPAMSLCDPKRTGDATASRFSVIMVGLSD